MRRANKEIWNLIEPVTRSMGYEFVGAEFGQAENGMTLRVYIDLDRSQRKTPEQTVLLDDCAEVSRQLSALLDVEDPIKGEYVLEVSSPGLNRPLFSASQFEAQIGEVVKLKLHAAVEAGGSSRRNFKGTLVAVTVGTGDIELEVDGDNHRLSIDDIEQARLVYSF